MRVFLSGAALGLAALLVAPAGAQINYGDFSGTTVDFVSVTEEASTDPLPLFGVPSVDGDVLGFDPMDFFSSAAGGSLDSTIGTLAFGIEAKPNFGIDMIELREAGDYTLQGPGSSDTLATVATPVFIDITEVDGVTINPITVTGNMVFGPSDGDYNLDDDGPGTDVQWTGSLSVDLNQALTNEGITYTLGATKVEVILNNILATASEADSTAFIQKTDFDIIVPEPASLMLLSVMALAFRRR